MSLAGGIEQMGFQCGMLWGAALAAGAQAHQVFGAGPQAEAAAVVAAQRLVETFRAKYKAINCLELTGTDWKNPTGRTMLKFLVRGGPIQCFGMAASYAPLAADAIDSALAEEPAAPPCHPVSCAALLAQRMGASELHTVMAAGLAGGIGLCGGACGALGAAIWLAGLGSSDDETTKLNFNDPKAMDTIDRFVEASGGEFECSAIVGRKFEDVADHAGYLRSGGCGQIIEALAAQAG